MKCLNSESSRHFCTTGTWLHNGRLFNAPVVQSRKEGNAPPPGHTSTQFPNATLVSCTGAGYAPIGNSIRIIARTTSASGQGGPSVRSTCGGDFRSGSASPPKRQAPHPGQFPRRNHGARSARCSGNFWNAMGLLPMTRAVLILSSKI